MNIREAVLWSDESIHPLVISGSRSQGLWSPSQLALGGKKGLGYRLVVLCIIESISRCLTGDNNSEMNCLISRDFDPSTFTFICVILHQFDSAKNAEGLQIRMEELIDRIQQLSAENENTVQGQALFFIPLSLLSACK